jgi:hypothetical protein
MLASQLSHILTELCSGSDVSPDTYNEMNDRFESLRGYSKLPRGRENCNSPLTDEQIINALLGLVALRPGWAGHVVAVSGNLKPVGGPIEAFGNAKTLTEALCYILTNGAVRSNTIAVRLSAAETGTNNHGLAVITFECGDIRQELSFVRGEAVSLLQPNANFDADKRNSHVSRELIFNQKFFERLVRKINIARAHPSPPIGDGSEYDKEDAEQARRQRLGVNNSSNYLNIGVDNQVTWPRVEMLIKFDCYKLVLMPRTKENVQSVHIDLHANRLTIEEARTVVNRFLSLLTWCDDQYAILQDGWSGNPVPVPVPKRDLAFATTYQWVFNRSIPESEDARRALALYREGRNAEQNFMISYAVLSYFKVLEISYPDSKKLCAWIARTFPLIQNNLNKDFVIEFSKACGEESIDQYLWKACRVAVAHVREKYPSDPDILQELHRLQDAAEIMRKLARYFIKTNLGVSESPFGETSPP